LTAVGVAVLTRVGFGAIPAFFGASTDVMSVLKQGGGALGAGRSRARWQRASPARAGFPASRMRPSSTGDCRSSASCPATGDVIVRLAPGGSAPAVQAALQAVNHEGRAPEIGDLEQRFRELTSQRRFNAGLMTTFALLALVIAAAGVYGLMSFIVGRQRRSIGLRVAMGATAGRIFGEVLADSGRLLLIGVAIGLAGAWVAARLFDSVVYGVTGSEPWLYAVVAFTLGVTSVLAATIPAWRASRVDPLIALRSE
jgi:ABC-type antimicrobial peptide transport system permease subunit